eukprot:CAMPEP_0173428058 /NCGR_PEP_ID=MMETSP1357-20121228/7098_1 /TAXON_ID=77926 /ORGANISM="Hemiselmis rufescens, Strain PCC563" /LENGTH=89 /DNA_ID=CAMNT_0014392007 /DNA_START=95 /DNA_END=362 /DNA_ORIENTATION=-
MIASAHHVSARAPGAVARDKVAGLGLRAEGGGWRVGASGASAREVVGHDHVVGTARDEEVAVELGCVEEDRVTPDLQDPPPSLLAPHPH